MDVDQSLGSSPTTKSSAGDSPTVSSCSTCTSEKHVSMDNQSVSSSYRSRCSRRHTRAKRLQVDLSSLKRKKTKTGKIMFALSFATAVGAFALYLWARPSCGDFRTFQHVRDQFKKVYGQDRTIKNIVQVFEDISSSKLLLFYGPTGVGKTYSTRIIMERMYGHNNVFHFTASAVDIFSMKTVLVSLQHCNFTLVVVDDVPVNDSTVKTVVKEIVNKAHDLVTNVYVILVFSNEIVLEGFHKTIDELLRPKLELVYRDVPSSKYFIEFDQLTDFELQLCIEDAISLYKYKVPPKFSESMVSQFDVKADGCKSVTNKVKGMNFPIIY